MYTIVCGANSNDSTIGGIFDFFLHSNSTEIANLLTYTYTLSNIGKSQIILSFATNRVIYIPRNLYSGVRSHPIRNKTKEMNYKIRACDYVWAQVKNY